MPVPLRPYILLRTLVALWLSTSPLPTLGAQDSEDVPLVVDMGSHWLEGIVPQHNGDLPSTLVGTRITQVWCTLWCCNHRSTSFSGCNSRHEMPSY